MSVAVWWLCTNIPLFTVKPWWSGCNSSQIGPEPNTEVCIPKLGSALRPDGSDNQFTYLLDRKISSNQLTWQGLESSHRPKSLPENQRRDVPSSELVNVSIQPRVSPLGLWECEAPSENPNQAMLSILSPWSLILMEVLNFVVSLENSKKCIYSLQTHPTLKASALQLQFLQCTPLCWNTYSSP